MTGIAVSHLVSLGLWYYYIEVTWKVTGELSESPLPRINDYCGRWYRAALANQPEEQYLLLAIADRMAKDKHLDAPDAMELYEASANGKYVDVVPIMIERYDAFFERKAAGVEAYPGAKTEGYVRLFRPIIEAADSSHVSQLERFIAAHPALAELTPRLAEVRARPAPPPRADPPFRLGTEAVRTP